MQKGKIVFFGLFILVNPLCTASQKIENIETGRIIRNEKGGVWQDKPKVKLTLMRTIGGIDEKDPNLAFNEISDIVLDSLGNIYVLDVGNSQIQKLDSQGKYLQTLGRRGQGPGDFQYPFSLDIDSQDTLYVSESRNQRIQIMEKDGRAPRIIPLRDRGIFLIRHFPNRLIAKGGIGRPKEFGEKVPPIIEIIDFGGNIKKSFGEAMDFKDADSNINLNRIGIDTDQVGNIYLSYVYQNRIEKYSIDGKLLWRSSRPLNYHTNLDKSGDEPNLVSMGIAADGEGRVWVNTYNRQMAPEERSVTVTGRGRIKQGKIAKIDIHKLEIFDPAGALLGSISLNHLAHGLRIFRNMLFIWEWEDCIIYQYKIEYTFL